jgi:5S rRNA maturation endonuclease (ribonuclease M5)
MNAVPPQTNGKPSKAQLELSHAQYDSNDTALDTARKVRCLGRGMDVSDQPEVARVYSYADENGKPLFEVVRYDPKAFKQRRPNGKGGYIWRLDGVRRVLYRLPQVLDAVVHGKPVYICEGEKDVEALEAGGAIATCNSGGAGSEANGYNWCTEYSQALAGADVVVVADADAPGRAHAAHVARALAGVARTVRVVEAAEGKDAADHLAAGYTLQEFVEAGPEEAAIVMLGEPDDARSAFIDWTAFWNRDRDDAEWVYADVLARGRGHALYASHKLGKSLFMLFVAAALATGSEPIVVVYLDYEMTEADVHDRLEDMGYGAASDLSRLRYALLPTLAPLDTVGGADELMRLVDGVQDEWPDHHLVVIIDTISRAVVGQEDKADTWRAFYNNTGIALKRRGITWARLDHSGKDTTKGQRGSSGKGDDVDVVWALTRTNGGVCLRRDFSRMAWVPATVTFGMAEEPLCYRRLIGDYPEGTGETANLLERLKVPLDASTRVAAAALKAVDEGRRRQVVVAALRFRRDRREAGCE